MFRIEPSKPDICNFSRENFFKILLACRGLPFSTFVYTLSVRSCISKQTLCQIIPSSLHTPSLQVTVRSVSGRAIESKFVRVSVYAPLALHPTELILAPGTEYAVQVQGGPSANAQISLSSSNPTVVSVDPVSGLVKGEKEGQAEIRAVARSASGEILSESTMTVVVRKLVRAGLHTGTGRLGVGEEIDVFPEGVEPGEGLMSFAQVCYGYRWSVGDPEVLQLQTPDSLEVPDFKRGDELDPGFSARLAGKTPGKTTVRLSFSCRYGPPGSPPVQYNASADVVVLGDIPVNRGCCATWLLPPHYETTFTLPCYQSCGAETTIYSLLQSCPPSNQADNYVVKLLDEGKLQTGSRPDVECIHARVRSTGRAGLAACVRVAEIAQVGICSSCVQSLPLVDLTQVSRGCSHKVFDHMCAQSEPVQDPKCSGDVLLEAESIGLDYPLFWLNFLLP